MTGLVGSSDGSLRARVAGVHHRARGEVESPVRVGPEELAEVALVEPVCRLVQHYGLDIDIGHAVVRPREGIAVVDLPKCSVDLPVVIDVREVPTAVNEAEWDGETPGSCRRGSATNPRG